MEAAHLWGAVVASGLWHGANPGMGWPLAVSAALMARRASALPAALGALAAGHAVAMLAVLLPFAALTAVALWEREIRLAAGAAVCALGLWLLFDPRHPRILARVPPSRLALWSFLVAPAHGAGLMLVPIYLGICAVAELDAGHRAAAALMGPGGTAIGVALAHTAAMMAVGGALAIAIYRWVGLGALSRIWLDLDRVWAASLVLVGALGLWSAL